MANEAVDALFAMGLPVPLGVVRSLVEGIDGILQRCSLFLAASTACAHTDLPDVCKAMREDEGCAQQTGRCPATIKPCHMSMSHVPTLFKLLFDGQVHLPGGASQQQAAMEG